MNLNSLVTAESASCQNLTWWSSPWCFLGSPFQKAWLQVWAGGQSIIHLAPIFQRFPWEAGKSTRGAAGCCWPECSCYSRTGYSLESCSFPSGTPSSLASFSSLLRLFFLCLWRRWLSPSSLSCCFLELDGKWERKNKESSQVGCWVQECSRILWLCRRKVHTKNKKVYKKQKIKINKKITCMHQRLWANPASTPTLWCAEKNTTEKPKD